MSTIIKGKIIKRKKLPVEFGANFIDSTAPVKKVLDDLQHKNIQAYTFYCQNLRQRRTTKENNWTYHYTVTGHPLNAFPHDWDGDLNRGYFEPFSYKSSMPKVISKMRFVRKNDPVTEYMKIKSEWNRESRTLRLAAASSNIMQKYESFNEDVVQCPKHIVDMATHLDSDPDPYFDSSYNWYYAGSGNLQLICIDWVDYLLHSEFGILYLTQFYRNEMEVNVDHAASFDCEGNNIFETILSSQNIIAIRTRHKVYILEIVSSDNVIHIKKIKAIDSEIPFSSISFDMFHKNILYITTLDNKLTIVNLDRLKGKSVKLKSSVHSLIDNWNSVTSSERASYTHVARNCITIYDKRTNNPGHMWKGIREITDDFGCNDITAAKQCEGTTSLYFGTDHHLFLMDIRSHNKSKPKVVQRWTHGMQCVPTYLSVCNFEFNKEIICLSSQWCEDVCIVTNYIEPARQSQLNGVTMPYRPPSILNTLNEARQKRLCFDLYNPIDNRLCTAITGNFIMEHGENCIILMQNSLGDITCHTLYPEHMEPFIVDDSTSKLYEWAKSYQLDQKTFEVSSVEDIAEVWKELRKVPDSHRIGEGKLFCEENSKFNEKEIFDAFANEELDSGLLDVWTKNHNETTVEESSFTLNLHYTDSE